MSLLTDQPVPNLTRYSPDLTSLDFLLSNQQIANMTASLLAPTKKSRPIDPYASLPSLSYHNSPFPASSSSQPQSQHPSTPSATLTGGNLLSIEGIQLDINLGGVGKGAGGVEWVVRVGWVGVGGGVGIGGSRGLMIEVSIEV